ncbi:L-amino acid N-acyltransferase YncA [Paenibacillus sp. PastF-3]|uniref:arsinothricin resistance N-acetyltransferase ArsN1 family A n=1 Tax=unclassified Paenibacillus TaxID=185978 RepID=UPI0004F69755|nr:MULTISPECIES: arsinothricin resistance N-acetyltransferase ArsN1 family A [unclassified Paenibacillus]AIQ38006.1 GCN5 family acetyltransferase [Paenibacillus sp. FSL R5-0345]MDH6373690.1 L-amino acid N-acyltransferase YncA [Paenibacillus sp. PastF-3]
MSTLNVRHATLQDLKSILRIYNQGIEDRIATLETEEKDSAFMEGWFQNHRGRYSILVAVREDEVIGWASLNPYSHRCAYNGVADLSIYIDRHFRGQGIGNTLLEVLEKSALEQEFYKIVLFTFPFNQAGQMLYQKRGYRQVGVFEKQGVMDGAFIDVLIMEKLL